MEKITIGVLHEGLEDIATIRVLVRKIAKDLPQPLGVDFDEFEAYGPIVTKLKPAVNRFFHENNWPFAFFISDNDTDQERCRDIRSFVNTNSSYQIIVGCPEPTIESWLVNEENAVRNYFNLPGDYPIKNSPLHPKELLTGLISALPEQAIDKTNSEIYAEIAEKLDLNRLQQQDSEANGFLSKTRNFLKNVAKK